MINVEEIKQSFDKVLCYSQGLDSVSTDEVFEKWQKNKDFFIQKWKGSLIYEVGRVSFELDKEKKEELFTNYLNFIENTMDNSEISAFLAAQGYEAFFKNNVEVEYALSKEKTIPKGMKILKAFKYFEKNTEALEYMQNKGSLIIQENCVDGILCFSVHPLDYLSLSENSYNWRSCHALDGDYRLGNLNYMTDSSTIICYIRGENDVILNRFPSDVPWNSKKWRCLMFFSTHHNAIFAGRQYPFTAAEALNTIQPALISSLEMSEHFWTKWYNNNLTTFELSDGSFMELTCPFIPIKGKISSLFEIVKDTPDCWHYNDLLYSTVYKPYYCWKTNDFLDIEVCVGEKVNCIHCGKEAVLNTDMMICNSCYDDFTLKRCDFCGVIFPERELYWIEGYEQDVCHECYVDHFQQCARCGYVVRKDDMIWDEEAQDFLCPCCIDERKGN